MSDTKVGVLIEGFAYRDAIHIAIAPVEAGCAISPGGQIKFQNGSTTIVERVSHDMPDNGALGIADPFLTRVIKKGQKFYMFLFPQTITGMRHQWMHPAFPFEVTETQEAKVVTLTQKELSIKWMKSYAHLMDVDIYDLLDAGDLYVKHNEYWCDGGKFEGVSLPDEYWFHYEYIRDTSIPTEKKGNFFSCSC